MAKKKVRIGWRYRIVTVFGLTWNACGAADFALNMSRNEAYLALLPDRLPGWLDGLPLWVQIAWGTGTAGALLGSLLMIARLRLAVPVFALALIGLSTYLGYQALNGFSPAMTAKPLLVYMGLSWFVLAYLLLYALRCWKRVLR